MKSTLFALLSFLALPVFSQETATSQPRTITVTGRAERALPADRVCISAVLRVVRNPFNTRNTFAAMAPDSVGGEVSLEAMVEVTFELTE